MHKIKFYWWFSICIIYYSVNFSTGTIIACTDHSPSSDSALGDTCTTENVKWQCATRLLWLH